MRHRHDSLFSDEEQSDAVWALLREARLPEPDGWFTARTLARCRNEAMDVEPRALTRVWRWALGSGLGVCLALFLTLSATHPASSPLASRQQNVQEAFQIMATMEPDADGSVPSSSSSSWQDSSL